MTRGPADMVEHPRSHVLRLACLLGAYWVLYAGASFLTSEFVLTDRLLEQEWSANFDAERVLEMLDQRQRWTLLGYVVIPAVLFIKILYTTLCLLTGFALLDWRVRFRDVFQVGVHAEAVFAIAAVIHLVWTLLGRDFQSVAEYAAHYPFSALEIVSVDEANLWMAYGLKTANVFEVVYVAALCWGLADVVDRRAIQLWPLIAASYGTGLLLLICAVTFLSLYVL